MSFFIAPSFLHNANNNLSLNHLSSGYCISANLRTPVPYPPSCNTVPITWQELGPHWQVDCRSTLRGQELLRLLMGSMWTLHRAGEQDRPPLSVSTYRRLASVGLSPLKYSKVLPRPHPEPAPYPLTCPLGSIKIQDLYKWHLQIRYPKHFTRANLASQQSAME